MPSAIGVAATTGVSLNKTVIPSREFDNSTTLFLLNSFCANRPIYFHHCIYFVKLLILLVNQLYL